jgi:hypothetical protein
MIRRPIEATAELARICRPPVGSQPVPPNDDKWSWPSGYIGGYASCPGCAGVAFMTLI